MVSCKKVEMKRGEMNVYDFGNVRLHAYQTNDPIADEVFILEKAKKAVVIELPCFKDNIQEISAYIATLDVEVEGKLVAYHAAGASFLPQVKAYGTENSIKYNTEGGGKALVDNFAKIFGEIFDQEMIGTYEVLTEGPVTIAGLELQIVGTPDAYNVEIPAIKTVYLHMMGHDCHSIVAGAGHADALIQELSGYLNRGFELFLTSHYTPENQQDAQAKIAYLENLKKIAARCHSSAEFKAEVEKQYPAYTGENYLEMTAGFFFPQ